jgi:hypothetical protein
MIAFLRRTPSAVLLLTQLAGILLYPWIDTSPRGHALVTAFGVIVLGLTLRVVGRTPWLTWAAFVLAFFVITLSVINALAPQPGLTVTIPAMEAIFYFYAAGSLISYMLQDWVATTDEFFAAGATFTLLAWAFAYMYVVCQALVPGSFTEAADAESARTWMELLFLSVAVLSSVGLSDILPASPLARSLVMLESFAGIMYIALVVSRLISLSAAELRDRARSTDVERR